MNMQDFKIDMKIIYYFMFYNTRLPRGQPSETLSLPPANSSGGGASGQLLISNTVQTGIQI